MILSRKWANDYVDLTDIDNKTFCDEMTLSGSKVEGYEVEGSDIENVVVGQVLSMEKTPGLRPPVGVPSVRRRRSAAANRHRRPELKAHGHCAGGTGGCYGDQPQRP